MTAYLSSSSGLLLLVPSLALLIAGVPAAQEVPPPAGDALPEASTSAPLDRLAWLTGTWRQVSEEDVVEEQWMAPLGTSMIGGARTVAGGKTTGYEHLRIQVEDGTLVYVAIPSNQEETHFAQVEIGERSVTFANPDHDFPRRIRYSVGDEGLLVVNVTGLIDGVERGFDLRMKRVTP